jgi:hypothetical protein
MAYSLLYCLLVAQPNHIPNMYFHTRQACIAGETLELLYPTFNDSRTPIWVNFTDPVASLTRRKLIMVIMLVP